MADVAGKATTLLRFNCFDIEKSYEYGPENPDLQVTLAIVPDHAHREINPAGTTAGFLGFPKRWRGIIGKIRVPLPENLLVKWRSHASRGFNLSSMYLL